MENKVKQRMLEAKRLIESQQYDKARAILITIDHPTAEKWLSKLPAPQAKAVPNKSLQTGCAAILLAIVLCGLIIAFYPYAANEYDVTMAAYQVSGVLDVERVLVNDNNPYIYVDVCVAVNVDTIAQEITNAVRRLNGTKGKQIWVTVTDLSHTRSYIDGAFIGESEREFCL